MQLSLIVLDGGIALVQVFDVIVITGEQQASSKANNRPRGHTVSPSSALFLAPLPLGRGASM